MLRDYLDNLEADPQALESITERLFLIADLKRKYGETIADILGYAENAQRRLNDLQHRTQRLAELAEQEARLRAELGAAASALSARRAAAAETLANAVERELADLRLAGARFSVAFARGDDSEGLEIDGQAAAFDSTGIDRIEMLLAANPGEELRPLARVASGGELARMALALKTILTRAETRATLIFDEIDVGVGGRTAPVVGEKLWSVASAGHQVLCVTHLPQVAAFADRHFAVAKQAADGRADARVTALEPGERLEELASMLAGTATKAARTSARELLERAEAFKVEKLSLSQKERDSIPSSSL
jgi:DNA repair protein RecN (Recombination protein N)